MVAGGGGGGRGGGMKGGVLEGVIGLMPIAPSSRKTDSGVCEDAGEVRQQLLESSLSTGCCRRLCNRTGCGGKLLQTLGAETITVFYSARSSFISLSRFRSISF